MRSGRLSSSAHWTARRRRVASSPGYGLRHAATAGGAEDHGGARHHHPRRRPDAGGKHRHLGADVAARADSGGVGGAGTHRTRARRECTREAPTSEAGAQKDRRLMKEGGGTLIGGDAGLHEPTEKAAPDNDGNKKLYPATLHLTRRQTAPR